MDRKWGEIYKDKGTLTKHFPCHAGQAAVLSSSSRFVAAIAGTGGGKSVTGALWLMNEIRKAPMGKYLILTPTFKVLRSATLPAWKLTVEGTDLEGEHKVADSEYTLPTGGVIYLRSAEDPRSMQGIVATAAWVDEGGLISREAWDTVLQRVGYHKGRVLITTTPYSHNFLFKEVYSRWKAGDKDYHCVQFSSLLNPTYPREEYERAKDTLPAHRHKMLYDGEFARAAGLVYPDMSSCVVDAPDPFPTGRLVGGLDFGFAEPFAALAGVLDDEDVLWLFYERYMRFKGLEEHAARLPREVEWFADESRPDSIRDLVRLGYRCRRCPKGAGSIQKGLSLVHSRMATGRLKIIRGTCPNLLDEAELYRYPDRDEEVCSDVPVAEHDHACDALRYLVFMVDRRRRLVIDSPEG